MEAEIITIGTELLLGEIVDTNSRTIARALRDIGLDIYRTSTVGDNTQRIAQAVNASLHRAQAVIITGGLGPTVDDVTREAVAEALDVDLEFHPSLWDQIIERAARFGLRPTENNRRQAFLPQGAIAIENPIGSAPAFFVNASGSLLFALPGVPAEMSYLLEHDVIPALRQKLDIHDVIITHLLHVTGMGESKIDELIQDLEHLSNPTVGLAAHPGQVDIRIAAKASSPEAAGEMIAPLESAIRDRLGTAIYGVDDETLEQIATQTLAARGWRVAVVECGTGSALSSALALNPATFAGGQLIACLDDAVAVEDTLTQFQDHALAEVGLGLILRPGEKHQHIDILLHLPDEVKRLERNYGGPPTYAVRWAISAALNLLRRSLS